MDNTRALIVSAADRLFYQQGYANTSFSQIAQEVQISRGNFYYHFKSKDDILTAVIEHRLQHTQQLLEHWQDEGHSPKQRIACFIRILLNNQLPIRQFGCPVGTLTSELAKLQHLNKAQAAQLFTLFKDWLSQQFRQLGYPQQADSLALHLLARSQGIATLANAFDDQGFIEQEVQLLMAWLDQLSQAAEPSAEGEH
ncbi:TetR/AcrR family transcriptional regulator [Balneatrix alpica]|uniref:TetR/AcrR family transcriptional regulator n=1 Tax=Balneatrix alpica TaxID=75684 RepID=UPI002739648E|nr:TetR/AcrR family transcriptional regulator [Balneatrix alpica]